MKSPRVIKLQRDINNLEDQIAFCHSAVSICMSEANLLDLEIEEYVKREFELKRAVRDLLAELADTV